MIYINSISELSSLNKKKNKMSSDMRKIIQYHKWRTYDRLVIDLNDNLRTNLIIYFVNWAPDLTKSASITRICLNVHTTVNTHGSVS